MSIVGVMITNGGTHSPEKWAAMTASQIIQIGEQAPEVDAAIGRRLELTILVILEDAHKKIQDIEKGAIAAQGPEYLKEPLDPRPYIDDPLNAIIEATKASPYQDHFAKDDTQAYLRRMLAQHFGTAMHIERQTYADTIPDNPIAQAYKDRANGKIM